MGGAAVQPEDATALLAEQGLSWQRVDWKEADPELQPAWATVAVNNKDGADVVLLVLRADQQGLRVTGGPTWVEQAHLDAARDGLLLQQADGLYRASP